MSSELLNKLLSQKKFRHKLWQKLLENSTQLDEYLNGQVQSISDNLDTLPANEFNQAGNDLRFLFEVDSSNGSTKGSESRAGDSRLTTTIEDNFFYQHMFNFALVVILLLQVIVVWAFIWCRLSKIGNQPINPSQPSLEDGIALNEINQLPELIPQHHEEMEQNDNGAPAAGAVNRCGRYG